MLYTGLRPRTARLHFLGMAVSYMSHSGAQTTTVSSLHEGDTLSAGSI